MRRRTFIRLVGASALGLPLMHSSIDLSNGKREAPLAANMQRTPLEIEFAPEEAAVISRLQEHSAGVYLLGGNVLAKATGTELPYLNLLVDSKQFGKIKNDLFRFGVTPLSTPELPSNFIRFVYKGKAYSALNLEFETFSKHNLLEHDSKLLPLAHSFVAYSTNEHWVLDPYGALQAKTRQRGYRVKVLQRPASPLAGLELCLAVAFDTVLLGLEAPAGHAAFEKRVLNSTTKQEQEATLVFHGVVSYFPDLIEMRGLDFTRKYLLSPLCVTAASAGPGIDMRKVDASLRTMNKRGKEVSSSELLSAINEEFREVGKASALGTGLPDYLAAKKLPLRRKDLMQELMAAKKTQNEVLA